MFTGIISHLGYFKEYNLGKRTISIEAPTISSMLEIGESLALPSLTRIGAKEHNVVCHQRGVAIVIRLGGGEVKRIQCGVN